MAQRTILFAGDSITDAGRREDAEHLGDGYVRLIAQKLAGSGDRVVNAGIGGDRVRDLRARWEADVLAEKPDVLTVLVGVNDMWRRYDAGDATSAAEFRADYDAILSEAAGAGASLILMEPFLVPISDEQQAWRVEDLDEKIAVVRELAEAHGATLVGLDAVLVSAGREKGAAEIAFDGVHPTPEGHALIADEWVAAAGPLLG
jgi:acyl-CoA thioesterase I